MPTIAPVTPEILKSILELAGFQVVAENDLNWALAKEAKDEPIIIPKAGDLVALDVMEHALACAKLTNPQYFTLVNRVRGISPAPSVN